MAVTPVRARSLGALEPAKSFQATGIVIYPPQRVLYNRKPMEKSEERMKEQ